MKALVQPLAWWLALAAILAMASGVAMDVAVISPHDATILQNSAHHKGSEPPRQEGMTRQRFSAGSSVPAHTMQEGTTMSIRHEMELHTACSRSPERFIA